MSLVRHTATIHCCATCAYWTGSREVKYTFFCEFDTQARGKCMGGGHNRETRPGGFHCIEWEVWPPIAREKS
jgi:hypothetical protein